MNNFEEWVATLDIELLARIYSYGNCSDCVARYDCGAFGTRVSPQSECFKAFDRWAARDTEAHKKYIETGVLE